VEIELTIPGFPSSGLTVRQFDIVEGLSTPFEVALVALSPDADLDLERIVGQPGSFHLANGALGSRTWAGVFSYAEQMEAEPAGQSTYALRLVPRLWLLSQRRGHRVFQHQTALDIVRALLAEWKIDVFARVTEANLARHELRVQYGEADLDFVSRLLEEAGLSYTFDDSADPPSRFLVTDAPERADTLHAGVAFSSEPSPTQSAPFAADVEIAHEVRTGVVTLADFDFRRPRFPVVYRAEQPGPGEARLESYTYEPGSGLADLPAGAIKADDTPVADDQSHARIDEHQGYALAERRLAALREDRRRVQLSTNLLDLAPGAVFVVAGSPRPELTSQRLLALKTNLDGRRDGNWSVRVAAAFASAPVRPPRRVPWPRVEGLQSALVVGPAGEEIHTDEFGRVRVRFHWDRLAGYDDHAFAWVRAGEGWAGSGFGMVTLPRIGQEVLVAFSEGNPDQPVIVGRLFGGSNPVPNGLPAGRTQTVWRTRATPGSSGFHELSFDDTAGRERVFLRSERDLEKVVVAAETEQTDGDRTMVIGANLGAHIGATDAITAGQMHEVRMVQLAASHVDDAAPPAVTQLATRREIIAKRITLTTGGAMIVLDGPDITVTAEHEVRIQAGGTVIIQGEPTVHINPPLVTRKADAAKAPPPPPHTVWFRLVSLGHALAGALVHLEHPDGTTSAPQTTDGNGQVRLPVAKPGAYQIKIGNPPPKPAPAKPPPQPAAPAVATFPPTATAPAPIAKPAAPPPPATKPAIPVGTTPAQPTAKAKPTDHEVPVTLQIVSPAPGATFEIDPGRYPGPEPSMPLIPLQAKVLVQGKETSVGSVRWEFSISGKYRVRDHKVKGEYRWQDFKFAAGDARTLPNEEKKFQLTPAELTGGDLEIKAVFEGGPELGNITTTQVLKGLKVVGKNGPRLDVEQFIADQAGELAWLFLRMFCHESDHTLAEFLKTQPRYGPPSGVGVAQQDPEEEEWVWPKDRLGTPSNFFPRIFWDWRKNVVSGMQHFLSDKVPTARRIIAKLRKNHPGLPQPPEGLVYRAAIRAYNGGRELAVSADGKHFIVQPQTIAANVGYVGWVLDDPHGTLAPKHPVPDDVKLKVWPAD
jgi:type VI secretion system secreted protein VgrG